MTDAVANQYGTTQSHGQQWTPPPNMVTHSGRALEPGTVFFEAPPTDIGQVVSAFSTHENNKSISKRLKDATLETWMIPLFVLVAGFFLTFFLVRAITGSVAVGGLVGLIVGGGIFLWLLSKLLNSFCSYVGTYGIARFDWNKDAAVRAKPDMLRFSLATELRTQETEKFENGVYQSTDYDYTWSNSEGATVHRLFGLYRGQNALPQDKDDYPFAVAAERSWSAFVLAHAQQELTRNSTVRFNASNGDFFTLGNGFIDITQQGQTVRCSTADLTKLSLNKGVVTLSTKDSSFRWFSSTGTYSFKYHDIANARVFLLLFDALVTG